MIKKEEKFTEICDKVMETRERTEASYIPEFESSPFDVELSD